METPRTVEECKRILFKLGLKHGIPPRLISERLLSRDDKEDMLQGHMTFETLDCVVQIWKESGMCNYADGTGEWYSDFKRYAPRGWGGAIESGYNRKFTPLELIFNVRTQVKCVMVR